MESEERPTKVRKIEHSTESADSAASDSILAEGKHVEVAAQSGEQSLLENHHEQNGKPDGNPDEGGDAVPKMSKNQLKKQRRHEQWEAGREDRKAKRKEKIKAKRERRREEYRQKTASAGGDAAEGTGISKAPRPAPVHVQVPITVIFDCDFEDLMFDHEMKSLQQQITRCYSDNRKAKYQAHLAISSFGGKMKERFDGLLDRQYTAWKGVRFFSDDFVQVAEKAKDWMQGPEGGSIEGAIAQGADADGSDSEGEVVYLSSESDVTLERLKPKSTYIIGGLVDKNRHKGLCHKRATERGIKTAKLPIGEYLHMKSRQVLVTNHVMDIMLKWIEFDDWGKAFIEVMPKRKGGVLKSVEGTPQAEGDTDPAAASSWDSNAVGQNDEQHVASENGKPGDVAMVDEVTAAAET